MRKFGEKDLVERARKNELNLSRNQWRILKVLEKGKRETSNLQAKKVCLNQPLT